jgi:hypothetical protein
VQARHSANWKIPCCRQLIHFRSFASGSHCPGEGVIEEAEA